MTDSNEYLPPPPSVIEFDFAEPLDDDFDPEDQLEIEIARFSDFVDEQPVGTVRPHSIVRMLEITAAALDRGRLCAGDVLATGRLPTPLVGMTLEQLAGAPKDLETITALARHLTSEEGDALYHVVVVMTQMQRHLRKIGG